MSCNTWRHASLLRPNMARASWSFVSLALLCLVLSAGAGSMSKMSCSKSSCEGCLESSCNYEPKTKSCTKMPETDATWYAMPKKLRAENVEGMCSCAESLVEGNPCEEVQLNRIEGQTDGSFAKSAHALSTFASARKGMTEIAGELSQTVLDPLTVKDQVEKISGYLEDLGNNAQIVTQYESAFTGDLSQLWEHVVESLKNALVDAYEKLSNDSPDELLESYANASVYVGRIGLLVKKVTGHLPESKFLSSEQFGSEKSISELVHAYKKTIRELQSASRRIRDYFYGRIRTLIRRIPRPSQRLKRPNHPCETLAYIPLSIESDARLMEDLIKTWRALQKRIEEAGAYKIRFEEDTEDIMIEKLNDMKALVGVFKDCIASAKDFVDKSSYQMGRSLDGASEPIDVEHEGFKVRVENGEPCRAAEKYKKIKRNLEISIGIYSRIHDIVEGHRQSGEVPTELKEAFHIVDYEYRSWEDTAKRTARQKRRQCDKAIQDAKAKLDDLLDEDKVSNLLDMALKNYGRTSDLEMMEKNAKCAMIAAVIKHRRREAISRRQQEKLNEISRMVVCMFNVDSRPEAECTFALYNMNGLEDIFPDTSFKYLSSEIFPNTRC